MARQQANRFCPGFDNGFTLLEVLIALTIFSLVMGTAFSSFSISLRRTRQSLDEAQVSAEAQSIFDRVGTDLPLKTGEFEGVLDTGRHWHLVIKPYGDVSDQGAWQVQAFQISLQMMPFDHQDQQLPLLQTIRLARDRKVNAAD